MPILKKICRAYRTDVKRLLEQVDQNSLRGNLQYQGFLQRQQESRRRIYWVTATCAMCLLAIAGGYRMIDSGGAAGESIRAVHMPLSLEVQDVEGKEILKLIAEYGELTIRNLESVEGNIASLKVTNEPWDTVLAMTASELGYRVEITGSHVDLIPVKKLQ